ncbi:hypothetical protein [Modicisalibacter luteus]|uniref:hypothetical protein n=1 Tax=Modicisalibacter luteus TaxID=453962 RepID=UPI003635368A
MIRLMSSPQRRLLRLLPGLGSMALLPMPSFAAVTDLDYVEAGIKPPSAPHTFYESVDGRRYAKAGLMLYGFGAVTDDLNFGSSYSIDGAAPTQEDPAWWEAVIQPALTAGWNTGAGTFFTGCRAVTP